MKTLGLSLAAAAIVVTGCTADHNDAVLPGYYDGYHVPKYPSYYGVQTVNAPDPGVNINVTNITNATSAPLNDADDTSD
jgi:hypothetical protein